MYKLNTNYLISSFFVETDDGKCPKPNSEQTEVQHHKQPHAAFVPLGLDYERSAEAISLQVSSEVISRVNKTRKQYMGISFSLRMLGI